MKIIEKIREHIQQLTPGEPFTAKDFRHLATSDNIRQSLGRMVKNGEIKRISHGVYVSPEILPLIGETLPSAQKTAEAITKATGETIAIHGAEAARMLQLTTQVPMQLVLYTSGNSRKLTIGNRTVTLKHVNPSKLICAGTTAGIVISALSYLGKANVTIEVINKISKQLPSNEFQFIIKQINHMPIWMADLFFNFQQGSKDD